MTNRTHKGVPALLFFPFLKDQARVVASETEGVAQRIHDIAFLRLVEGEVNAIIDVLVCILRVMIDGRRDDAVLERHHACDSFYGTRRADQMTGHGLGGVEVHVIDMVAEHALDSFHFRHVAERGGGAVRIDKINLLGLQTRIA